MFDSHGAAHLLKEVSVLNASDLSIAFVNDMLTLFTGFQTLLRP